jgi:hypothetical protein
MSNSSQYKDYSDYYDSSDSSDSDNSDSITIVKKKSFVCKMKENSSLVIAILCLMLFIVIAIYLYFTGKIELKF